MRRVRQLGGWCLSERPASWKDMCGAVIFLGHANYPPLPPKHVHFVAFSLSCFCAYVSPVSPVL